MSVGRAGGAASTRRGRGGRGGRGGAGGRGGSNGGGSARAGRSTSRGGATDRAGRSTSRGGGSDRAGRSDSGPGAVRGGRSPSSARAPTGPAVAVLARRGRLLVAEPLFERGRRHGLDARARDGATEGELVLLGYGKRGVRVARRLGRPDVARDVLEALMLDRGMRRSFPHAAEAEAVEAAATPAWSGPRRDLTELPTFTVDPVTAKDFDDAISARREGSGEVRVWVHIADVSAYVRLGGRLEAETLERATSVYVPGAVEPMLPHPLSSDACSLRPGEPRAAVTAELLLRDASVVSASFHRSTIRSDARLTYEQVERVFAGRERAADPWAEPLEAAREVAAALRAHRAGAGTALEVDSLEPSFLFDSDGHVTGVVHEEQTEAHELIEHLMILANEQVAGHLADRRLATLYRVHERPDPASVERLVEQLASLGVPTPPVAERMSPQEAAEVAAEASRHVAAWVRRNDGRGRQGLTALVLRSLKQAAYSPQNTGHAGLGSARYCHFTSPIRRYPDLVCHRALLASLGLDDVPPRAEELADVALHSSLAEREGLRVERDAADVCSAFLLEHVLAGSGGDQAFEGEVVGVIGKGAFVRFAEQGFEGFLPARRLGTEWYALNDAETALVGEESGRALRFGDPVTVEVERVDAPRGRVDLAPADAR
jgi:ribonuclease R